MENLGAFNIERDIVRLVTELVKDQPVTNSNGPHVMTSQTTGNKENQTPHNPNGGRLYNRMATTIETIVQQNGDNQLRNYLDSRTNDFNHPNTKICQFCKNNGEPFHVYSSHAMKDKRGRVVCMKLRSFICPICGATGDDAHTKKYCSFKPLKLK